MASIVPVVLTCSLGEMRSSTLGWTSREWLGYDVGAISECGNIVASDSTMLR